MLRWLRRLALSVVLLVVVVVAAAWWMVRGSLPALDGELALPGLSAPVTIARDALGIVTIDAAGETDAMRALGYVHGQERYFEMDLMRRMAAGELSALFGARAVDTDRRQRTHRMRARVDANLEAIAAERMPQLQAYADGVNAGRDALRVRPWPYLLLRRMPEPWTPADSALAGYAMYFDLQDAANTRELALWRMRPHLPPALFALLVRDGTRWDAPMLGAARGDAPLPDADAVDLRSLPTPPDADAGDAQARSPVLAAHGDATGAGDLRPGSNNFAVSGALTADGRAIVADDMHLGLRAPNIWFRARLRYPDPRAPGGRVDVAGFTLPGLPAVIVGSNTHVAWGFTNSYGDYLDWSRVRPCSGDSAAAGCDAVISHREVIQVAGGAPVVHVVEDTAWGPILHREADGVALALRWTAHLPGALNFGLADFAIARDLDQALRIADRTAMPTQNLAIADSSGRVGWRLLGPIAARAPGCSGTAVANAAESTATRPWGPATGTAAAGAADVASESTPSTPCRPWPLDTAAAATLASPTAQRIWTANARVVDGAALAAIGDGGYALGARASQIRDGLLARERFTERDLLAIQLDDRALFLGPWWQLLQDVASESDATATRLPAAGTASTTGQAASSARRTSALRALADASRPWSGRASIDSASYRIVRAWRLAVHARVVDGLLAPARAALGEDFTAPELPQVEGVVWPLLQQRPPHLLPRRHACASRVAGGATCDDADGWLALLEDAAVEVRDELAAQGPLEERRWGERNTTAICHPLAGAIPLLGKRLLCMPARPLPGDGSMPRVQGPAFGASQRMVVSPGHEADGIAHAPGGQSGHPMSPFWGSGHADWAGGAATAFLPGAGTHQLTLQPAATD